MLRSTFIAGILFCSILFNSSKASITTGNDSSIIGNGNTAQDGMNLTIDTNTSLEWLDLTLSLNMSMNEVLSELGAGGLFEGFRYATRAEIDVLWSNAGIAIPSYTRDDPDTPPLMDKLGRTHNASKNTDSTVGFYDDSDSGADPSQRGYAELYERLSTGATRASLWDDFDSYSFKSPVEGSYLVRQSLAAVPEPTTLLVWSLLGASAVGLSYPRWRSCQP